jgi:hypothetical protein
MLLHRASQVYMLYWTTPMKCIEPSPDNFLHHLVDLKFIQPQAPVYTALLRVASSTCPIGSTAITITPHLCRQQSLRSLCLVCCFSFTRSASFKLGHGSVSRSLLARSVSFRYVLSGCCSALTPGSRDHWLSSTYLRAF